MKMIERDTTTIYAYGRIGEDYTGEDFASALRSATAEGAPTVRLHTPGGSVYHGLLMYNAIRGNTRPVTMRVDGMAASMGAVVMLAASRIIAASNAVIMIHAPRTYVEGSAGEIEKEIESLRAIERVFAQIFTRRGISDVGQVAEWLDGSDHWYTSAEALGLGLVDEIGEAVVTSALSKRAGADAVARFCAALREEFHPGNTPGVKRFDDYTAAELLAMRQTDRAKYDALLEAKYNPVPPGGKRFDDYTAAELLAMRQTDRAKYDALLEAKYAE